MIQNFTKGETIVHEGDPSACAYLVDEGEVEVIKDTGKGVSKRVAVLRAGDMFGEMGLIDNMPRSATVRATKDCLVTVLMREDYQTLLQDDPKALMKILKVYSDRLRTTLKLLEDMERDQRASAA